MNKQSFSHVELEPVILDDSEKKYFGKYKQSHIVHLQSQNKLLKQPQNPISVINLQDDAMLREITEINDRVEESIGRKARKTKDREDVEKAFLQK